MELNLDYANASRLLLPSADNIMLMLVGCGGTGSQLAPAVVKVAKLLGEKFGKKVSVIFVDPDYVEPKNIYRQNFAACEIGRGKAESLAFRYGLSWGVEIEAISKPFERKMLERLGTSGLAIVLGCVDNAAARMEIQEGVRDIYSSARAWWIDCGNSNASGQVVVGCGSKSPDDPFKLSGMCTWLPLPTARHPELLEAQPEDIREDTAHMSCADLALTDSQGLVINQAIAAQAADMLVRMLITKDLRKWGTYIDLASGTTRSKYIVR
jgi:PRTRC genetic system ThiF family protein